jgi:hypothetical protein
MAKKEMYQGGLNEFMNSLTDDEFTEFIQARDVPLEKLKDTGRESEGFTLAPEKEEKLDLREQLMIEMALQ